ncbi:hypothetical protein O4158_20990 [Gordonia amicalis]|uniref:hypothetical protein n=1 Tax=Gordonia amicalis TaxID=89053 RepID=UPI0022B5ABC8|nr:hypothetical protein [Gordonia amicalis]MCZ4581516.1 hypothetical protein [Gordonia amicalis]
MPITDVVTRVGGGAGWGYTSVTLDESVGCISVDDAKKHYPDLVRPPQPADTSADPGFLMTQKITGETYVRLGFGRNTGCLTTLGAQNGPAI